MSGILGYDFIRHFVLEIDYPHQGLRVHDAILFRHPAPNDSRWEVVALTLERNSPQILIRLNYLNGISETLRAFIDTGANGSVLFVPEMIEKAQRRGIRNIQIGQYSISHLQCCGVVPVYALNLPPFPYDLLLTGTLFGGARLIFDYQNRKLYLRVD